MLETIREYAAERLEEAGEAEALTRQHAEHFAELAERTGPDVRGRTPAVLDELTRDYANFRAALQWMAASRETNLLIHLSAALATYWYSRGPYAEARAWLDTANRRVTTDDLCAARISRGLGMISDRQGEYAVARSAWERALRLARGLGDRRLECACLNDLGIALRRAGEREAAREHLIECLRLAHELGEKFTAARAANSMGVLELEEGRVVEAEAALRDSIAMAERNQDPEMAMIANYNLGLIELRTGRTREAAKRLRSSIETAEDLRHPYLQGQFVVGLASVALFDGDAVRAARLVGVSSAIVERGGGSLDPYARGLEREISDTIRDRLGDRAAGAAFAAGRALDWAEAIAYALEEGEGDAGARGRLG
jgi:tetratricopeptide (TPR) repeat protein